MSKINGLVFLLFLGLYSTFFSQNIDQRLLIKYSEKELKEIYKNDPKEYQFLVNALDRGLFIGEIPVEKEKSIVFDGILNIDPNKTHTFISLGKEILDRYQYFKIEGTTKMLVIQPRIFLDNRVINSIKK